MEIKIGKMEGKGRMIGGRKGGGGKAGGGRRKESKGELDKFQFLYGRLSIPENISPDIVCLFFIHFNTCMVTYNNDLCGDQSIAIFQNV